MGVLIGSIDVTGLVMDDLFPTGIEAETETADNGSIIVYEKEVQFVQLDLLGGSDWGWLPLSIMRSLQALASVIGSTYELNYEGVISIVRFRTEDPPAIYGEKLIQRSNQANTDFYNNIFIKLMEI